MSYAELQLFAEVFTMVFFGIGLMLNLVIAEAVVRGVKSGLDRSEAPRVMFSHRDGPGQTKEF